VYPRRQFLIVAASQLLSISVFADSHHSTLKIKKRHSHRDILRTFYSMGDDPHIRAAIALAKKEISTESETPWQRLVILCSGREHTEDPRLILAGFQSKKRKALAEFKARYVDGYMLTNEEVILGQLLIST